MQGDFTRNTFNPRRRYSSVRMQQGRVQLDADWNEQIDVQEYHSRTQAIDVIGPCGAPKLGGGFQVGIAPGGADLTLSAGRFYVDGILCEIPQEPAVAITAFVNPARVRLPALTLDGQPLEVDDWVEVFSAATEAAGLTGTYARVTAIDAAASEVDLGSNVDAHQAEPQPRLRRALTYLTQPDFPSRPDLPAEAGLYSAYLDVWGRHVTALEDPAIRETALGGPDTATRVQTLWQVRWRPVAAGSDCLDFPTLEEELLGGPRTLAARAQPEVSKPDPCAVPAGAGYRRVENQFYRVEVHEGGTPLSWPRPGVPLLNVDAVNAADRQIRVVADILDGDAWAPGQWIELLTDDTEAANTPGAAARIEAVAPDGVTLTLDHDLAGIQMAANPRVRRLGGFKWSRDNGSVTFAITEFVPARADQVRVEHLGRDTVLGLRRDDWVEVLDDARELSQRGGALLRIVDVNAAERILTLSGPVTGFAIDGHPRVRRWEGFGPAAVDPAVNDGWLTLEDGVEVLWQADAAYRPGDYWQIPARTLSGSVEWPLDAAGLPLPQPPHGVRHHYCGLALFTVAAAPTIGAVTDCRPLFPALTELVQLSYLGGDGQEAMPDLAQPAERIPLPQPLRAGVSLGKWPVTNARVRFTVLAGDGRLGAANGAATEVVTTGPDGVAEIAWFLDPNLAQVSQRVEAVLLDAADAPVHLPLRYNANLSLASQVAYEPGDCPNLAGMFTVQTALERLAHLPSLVYVSGDGQTVAAGAGPFLPLGQPLAVSVRSDCGPVAGATVRFTIVAGAGRLQGGGNSADVPVGPDGIATCAWELDPGTPRQEVEATLLDGPLLPPEAPVPVRFHAEVVVPAEGINCDVVVGKGGQFPDLETAFEALRAARLTHWCICLLPGQEHTFDGGSLKPADDTPLHVRISGCGPGTVLNLRRRWQVAGLESFGLARLTLRAGNFGDALVFTETEIVSIEDCHLFQADAPADGPFVSIGAAERVTIRGNRWEVYLRDVQARPIDIIGAGFPDLRRAFERLTTRDFRRAATRSLADLAALPQQQRVVAGRRLNERANQLAPQMSGEEREAYAEFIRAASQPAVDVAVLLDRFLRIRDAVVRSSPGVALVLRDTQADTDVTDNHITGVISVGGNPGKPLEPSEIERLFGLHLNRRIIFAGPGTVLEVRGNRATRVVLGAELLEQIRSAFNAGALTLRAAYETVLFSGNTLETTGTQLAGRLVTLGGSAFPSTAPPDERPADVFAEILSVTGNVSTVQRTVGNSTQQTRGAGNVRLTPLFGNQPVEGVWVSG